MEKTLGCIFPKVWCVGMLCEERMIYNDPFLNKMRAESEDDDFSWKVGIVSDREGDVEMGQSGCG